MSVAAAILAGGAGRRMGADKATMVVDGTALARLVARAAAAVADPVVLVAPAGHPAATLGLATVSDPGSGPPAALAAALDALAAEHVLALAADHPALRPELLALLVELRASAPAVACRGPGGFLEPLVAVYERAPVLAAARAGAGGGSLRGLLAAVGARILEPPEWRAADPDGRSFTDLDTPADLAAWLGR